VGLLSFPRAASASWLDVQEPTVSAPTASSPVSRSGAVRRALFKVRWLRLLALPRVWVGLTIDLASLRDVRIPVHSVLGNLRQLRSFDRTHSTFHLDAPPSLDQCSPRSPRSPSSVETPVEVNSHQGPSNREPVRPESLSNPELPCLHLR
jgi:hypothetical protein